MKKRIALFLGTLTLLASQAICAEESHDHGHEETAFNPSNFIIHHVADAHEIHLWGDVHIPLPIIVYTEAHGLDVFMSSAFEGHGDVRTAVRPSGVTYELSHGHIAVASGHGHGEGSWTQAMTSGQLPRRPWPVAGRLLSIWRRSGGVNLADFPVLADLPIWRQLSANLAGPIWREFGRSGWNP